MLKNVVLDSEICNNHSYFKYSLIDKMYIFIDFQLLNAKNKK